MKKRVLNTIGLLGVGAITTSAVISCAKTKATTDANGNAMIVSRNGTIIKGSETSFDKLMDNLKKSDVQKSKQITNIFNAAVKYLYNQEQVASEEDKKIRNQYIRYQNWAFTEKKIKEKIKSANIQALEKESKIKERITARFKDSKEGFKKNVGPKWGESAWGAELARSYDGAKNDEEAINNLVIKEMRNNAYLRYSLTKTTTSFTKGELELGKLAADKTKLKTLEKSSDARERLKAKIAPYFEWLAGLEKEGMIGSSNKTKTLSQLADGDYITVISTSSYIKEYKSPSEIIGGDLKSAKSTPGNPVFNSGYLNKFDPMFVNHFLIKAVPDDKNKYSPWKISIDDLKKLLYSTDGQHTISEEISGFQGTKNTNTTAGKYKWEVDKKEKKLLELVSGNTGSKTNGGTLGLQDELEYVKGMASGFAIPILDEEGAQRSFPLSPKKDPITNLSFELLKSLEKLNGGTPIKSTSNFVTNIQNARGNGKTGPVSAIEWQDYVDGLISTQSKDKILEEMGRTLKDVFGQTGSKYRSAIYEGKNGNNKVVLSKFGIHIIKVIKVDKAHAKEEIKSMIHSDLEREKNGDTPYFNVLKELNKYSSDQFLIVDKLMKETKFLDFLAKEKNYSAIPNGNTFPNYNTTPGSKDLVNIKKALKSYNTIFNETRAANAVETHRKFIQESWFKKRFLNPNSNNFQRSVNDIYDKALGVAMKGLVN